MFAVHHASVGGASCRRACQAPAGGPAPSPTGKAETAPSITEAELELLGPVDAEHVDAPDIVEPDDQSSDLEEVAL